MVVSGLVPSDTLHSKLRGGLPLPVPVSFTSWPDSTLSGETRLEVTTGFGSSTLTTLLTVSHPRALHTCRVTVLSPGVEKVTAGADCVDVPAQAAAGMIDRVDKVSSPARLSPDRRPCTAAFEACGIGSSLICDQAIAFLPPGQATVWFPPVRPPSDRMGAMQTDERILSGAPDPEDLGVEPSLRPRQIDEYIGQRKIIENLKVFIRAARERRESLDHVLLFGPPGLGKTTLAHIISVEMGAPLRITAGPVLERAGDLAAILTNLD